MTDTSDQTAAPVLLGMIRLLAAAGLALAGYLLAVALLHGGLPAGCGAGSPCERVLSSRWSIWLGVPVSFPAVAIYLGLLAASLHAGPAAPAARRRAAWTIMLGLGWIAAGAAVWFILVQLLLLGEVCRYCMAEHAIGLAVAGLVTFALRRSIPLPVRRPIWPVAGAALAVVGVFAASQWALAPRMMALQRFDGQPIADASRYPSLGPRAPHVLLSLFDYTCPHCRVMHGYLIEAQKRYGSQIALIALPVPLDAACNPSVEETEPRHKGACELAQLAMAVFIAKGQAFEAMDSWLFEPEQPRSPAEARAKAEQLVGKAALDEALANPRVAELLHRGLDLHKATAGPHGEYSRLPKVVSADLFLVGQPASAEELFESLEKDLGVQPR